MTNKCEDAAPVARDGASEYCSLGKRNSSEATTAPSKNQQRRAESRRWTRIGGAAWTDLQSIAHALGGEVVGRQVLAPGPGHPHGDRSLSVKPTADGFVVHSFSPRDDWRECRDYVRQRLGMSVPDFAAIAEEANQRPTLNDHERAERARALWIDGRDPRRTPVELHFQRRGLLLPVDIAGTVLRYTPQNHWRDENSGRTLRVPAMLAPFRSIDDDEIMGVHRTRLMLNGEKLGRRMFGPVARSAIKIDPPGPRLFIGEGIESVLAARQLGATPAWALGSAGMIASFPVIRGVEELVILGERDAANERAARACIFRWKAAGRGVRVKMPPTGSKDFNDFILTQKDCA